MSVYTSTVNTARNVRDTAISKANTAEKNAKLQYKQALNSGNQEAISIAEKAIRDAKAAKEQARTEYKIVKEQAKNDKKTTKEQTRTENKILKEQGKAANEQTESDSDSGDNAMSKNKKGLGLQFSQSFYDNIGNAVKGQPTGNLADVKSKGSKEQAQNLRNAAATNQMEAQRAQQKADQNPFAESTKISSVQNDAGARFNVQKAGVLGPGAALGRTFDTKPDVQSEKQFEAQQQNVANQRREEEQANQQEATEKGNESEQWQFKSRDYTGDKNQAAALSKGEPVQPEQKPEEQAQPEQKPEEQAQPEQKPEEPSMPSGEPQHVINALLGSSKGEDLRSGQADAADKELYDWAISQGVKPIQAGQHKNESDVNSWEQEFIANNGEAGQNVMQQLRQGRAGAGNDASRNYSANEMDQMNKNMTVTKNPPSDARVKDIKQCLCDARMKWIKEDWDRDGKPSREDMMWLIKQNGLFHHNDKDYDPDDYDSWGDEDGSILGAYADNIKNYVYNYKPEATQVDPNIDPNQEHIGPMAQDIEHVNPACVKETPEGVKTVDTSRLAMMNAGVIGDLAREIQDIKMRLAKLGV